ncbi:unannotated protein [freshwater metagenome]|uniref:Unannotated protein n=1 Tax=freshwater metagenome TaxID=449393 RepID=A0A6J6T5B4_9ZZZZ
MRAGDDRMEVAARHGPFEIGGQGLDIDLLAGDEPVHEGFILGLGDDALDQLIASPVDEIAVLGLALELLLGARRPLVDRGREQVDEPDDVLALAVDRQDERQHASAPGEHPLADGDGLVEIGALAVELRHDNRAGEPDGLALIPELLRSGVDAIDR